MLSPRDVITIDDAKKIVESRKLTHIKVGVFDTNGVMLGKYLSQAKFFNALENGFGFCDVILGWDSKNRLFDNLKYTGWHTGYPDAILRVVPTTCRELFFEDNQLLFIAEFAEEAEALCPRGLLRRVCQKAKEMGFEAYAALEYEFFMFKETPDSVRAKGYRQLETITPDFFGYSILRNTVHSELYQQILSMAEVMDFPIEGLHTETGPGVLEAALCYDEIQKAADKAALFKTFMKVLAQRNQMMATFMAKWSPDYPGQSGHIHLSLRDLNHDNYVFHDASKPYYLSDLGRAFLAGQQQLMPEFLALFAPNINSYSRLIPGYWAPTHATWGVENRTTALRLIPGKETSERIEYRLGSADANPYLALAAALASGLYGIENNLTLGPDIKGNAYDHQLPQELALPSTLWDAAQRLKHSRAARTFFGNEFVDNFVATREWEEREFRRHITDWELDRYFEII